MVKVATEDMQGPQKTQAVPRAADKARLASTVACVRLQTRWSCPRQGDTQPHPGPRSCYRGVSALAWQTGKEQALAECVRIKTGNGGEVS